MSGNEKFSPSDPQFAVIQMASMMSGIQFENNAGGLSISSALLHAQHERVMPQGTKIELQRIVAKNSSLIQELGLAFGRALYSDNYAEALQKANHLYAYGNIERQDGIQGNAFSLSLDAHRAFSQRLQDRFYAVDDYLRQFGSNMLSDIQLARVQGNVAAELEMARGMIHTIVLNGTLGEKAKLQFDPYALVEVEK